MNTTIAIVEDDKNYNNTLKKIIEFNGDMRCIGQYFSGKEALEHLKKITPDVVLMDIQLQDILGIEVVKKLKPQMPKTQFMMCTSFEEDEKIFSSLKAGASGYLVKGESMEKIIASIKEIAEGGAPMTFSVARRVLQHFQISKPQMDELSELTKTENYILEELSKGLLYKEIADKKCVSIDTIKKHIGSIYRKLHVTNKIEAVNIFNKNLNQKL